MADSFEVLRRKTRLLLDLSAARDAMAAYYAFYHDPARTQLFVEEAEGRPQGFLAVCQTGQDLFRQLTVLRGRSADVAVALLRQGFAPLRPYYLVTTPDLEGAVGACMQVDRAAIHRIYQLDLRRYAPQINVLVTPSPAPDGSPRFVIRSQGEVAAASGVNWRSPHFAEIYVWTAPEARRRGWGKAVVNSCAAWVVRSGAQPLYIVSEENEPSVRLAESVGFVDTGAREFAVEGIARDDLAAEP